MSPRRKCSMIATTTCFPCFFYGLNANILARLWVGYGCDTCEWWDRNHLALCDARWFLSQRSRCNRNPTPCEGQGQGKLLWWKSALLRQEITAISRAHEQQTRSLATQTIKKMSLMWTHLFQKRFDRDWSHHSPKWRENERLQWSFRSPSALPRSTSCKEASVRCSWHWGTGWGGSSPVQFWRRLGGIDPSCSTARMGCIIGVIARFKKISRNDAWVMLLICLSYSTTLRSVCFDGKARATFPMHNGPLTICLIVP